MLIMQQDLSLSKIQHVGDITVVVALLVLHIHILWVYV
jgi:hypothetical protein